MQGEARLSDPLIPSELVPAPRAWHGPDLVEDDFKIVLPAECVAELEAIIAEQRKAPVPTMVLQPEHFRMDACRSVLAGVRDRLDRGLGFVIFGSSPARSLAQAGRDRRLLVSR